MTPEDRPLSVSEAVQADPAAEEEAERTPSRSRRAVFVFGSFLLMFTSSFYLALFGSGKLAELYVDGAITFMVSLGLMYIAGHSLDRSELLTKLGDTLTARVSKGPTL